MEEDNPKKIEAEIIAYIENLDAIIDSATHVNQIIHALQPLASKLFDVQRNRLPGDIVQDNEKQAVEIQSWKNIGHEVFRHVFYTGVSFPTLSKVLLFKVTSNWLACFPLSARMLVFDKFFIHAPAIEALQVLTSGLAHDHNYSENEEIDMLAVCSNAERILILCFVENEGIKKMALDFGGFSKCQTEENMERVRNMEISRMAQLVASIPDKARLEAPKVLSAHQFLSKVTIQLLTAAEERYKDIENLRISSVMDDGTFTFISETFARICRRGHADIVTSEMITVLIQHVRSYLDSESPGMHTPTESVNKTCELNFWQAIAAAFKDSYAMERWTEALLREMVIANLNDVEAYWIICMLFDEIFKNKASIRMLFTERFLLWKVFPVPCLRWILQFAVFRCSPVSEEHSQEQTNKIQIDVIRHLVRVWAKRDFIQSTSIEQQAYITAAVGLSLQKMTKKDLELSGELLPSILEGVSCRLDSPISPVRKMANQVALVFSQVIDAKKPLILDDDNCTEGIIDWEFGLSRKKSADVSGHRPASNGNDAKNTLHVLQNNGDHKDKLDDRESLLSEDITGTNISKLTKHRRKTDELKVDDPDEVIDLATLNAEDWSEDDNKSVESENPSESSLQPYDMSDDESDLKREKLPSQLSECVVALRKADDPDAVEGALQVIEKLVRAVPDELGIVAVDLVRGLIHVRCSAITVEGEEDSAEEKRYRSLVALLVSCPSSSVGVLAKELYSPNVDVSQRLLILEVMADAAVELSNFKDQNRTVRRQDSRLSAITELPSKSGSNPWYLPSNRIIPPGAGPWKTVSESGEMVSRSTHYERELPSRPGNRTLGKSRRWGHHSVQLREKKLQQHENWSGNRFPPYAAAFMLPIMNGYDKRRHGVDLLGRDFVVLGRLIYMLGVCMECVALYPEASLLAPALLDMLSSREISNHPEAYVRRSSLFAASRILIALHPSFIASSITEGDTQIARGLEWIRNWALHVAEVDSDFECSTMATACVQLHSEMAFQAFRSIKSMDEYVAGNSKISYNVPKSSIILPGLNSSNTL